MDKNKLQVLRDIDYQVKNTCRTCKHSEMSQDGWGYCNLHKYSHLKHTEAVSRLSINQFGYCSSYEKSDFKAQLISLGAFEEFFEDEKSDV